MCIFVEAIKLKKNIYVMNQEELKTCLGQLLLDLRGNWAYYYSDRLSKALQLCSKIEDCTEDVIQTANEELEEGDYDGRCFRDCSFYGYSSEDGSTESVKEWLRNNLTHPEYCPVLEKDSE